MGKTTALVLAKNGANVAIAGRNKENLTSTVSLAQATEKISAKEADVTDRNGIIALGKRTTPRSVITGNSLGISMEEVIN